MAVTASRPTSGASAPAARADSFGSLRWARNAQQLASGRARRSPYPALHRLSAPHVDSFATGLLGPALDRCAHSSRSRGDPLLCLALRDIGKRIVYDGRVSPDRPHGNKIEYWLEGIRLERPRTIVQNDSKPLYPSQCRERMCSYRGRASAKLCYQVNGNDLQVSERELGYLPVMVGSIWCNLHEAGPSEKVRRGEEPEDLGGYFVINGIERLARLLIMQRRNYPLAVMRPANASRGPQYSDYSLQIRCVRPDETNMSNHLHYLHDGSCIFRFSYRRQEFLVPVIYILRGLVNVSDRQIADAILQATLSTNSDTASTSSSSSSRFETPPSVARSAKRIEAMLSMKSIASCATQDECLAFLGSKFHLLLGAPPSMRDIEVGQELLRRLVLVHLKSSGSKFDLLCMMIRKLYAFVDGECAPENPDSTMFHELLLPGHLYAAYLKEKLTEILASFSYNLRSCANLSTNGFQDKVVIAKGLAKTSFDVGKKMEYFLATGNLVTQTGMNMMQMSGYTLVAEKLNFFRYISHFRSVHRGSFFADVKTTTVRKLLPESWGFLCPVHTPDGSPCGLLNHLSHKCEVSLDRPLDPSLCKSLLVCFGLVPMLARAHCINPADKKIKIASSIPNSKASDLVNQDNSLKSNHMLPVFLDGEILGYATPQICKKIVVRLRKAKVSESRLCQANGISMAVPVTLELAYVPVTQAGQYPGLYMFSTTCRMMRPVNYLGYGMDMVGTLEQAYMEIACEQRDIVPGITTHVETSPTAILSVVANMTPFSDYNQSPRNMYQCQMGKQTMGTPCLAISRRSDNKIYRIQTPQTPIVRPRMHNDYGVDEAPLGTNAIIAVISYTAYDMEDAMTINKSSAQRGFGAACIYKCETIEAISNTRSASSMQRCVFAYPDDLPPCETLEADGLPKLGTKLTQGAKMACIIDENTKVPRFVKYKQNEDAYVDAVRLIGSADGSPTPAKSVQIILRIPRPPSIGDKFSSRHGQKGVCSMHVPTVDMPFTESGIVPDVIINPHAFPSRMTIGMFVEQMAAKAGALHGVAQDATPFESGDGSKMSAVDYFGEQLRMAGYNYYGNEPVYSGTTGELMQADIYFGIVYYQRLRHMVSDKFQVRTTGPVDRVTQQPLKGRKRSGGIRFGEMERDSLLAHGASFLLQDRLLNCSDYSLASVCPQCKSFLSVFVPPTSVTRAEECRFCRVTLASINSKRDTKESQDNSDVANDELSVSVPHRVAVPYVFRYLCTELAAMGIRVEVGSH